MRTNKIIKILTFNTVFMAVLSIIEILIGLNVKNTFSCEILPIIFLFTIITSFISNILITFIKYKE